MVHGVGILLGAVLRDVVSLARFADVAVEDHLAVDRHGDAVAHGADLLHVPCAQLAELDPLGRNDAVDRAVLLVFAQSLVDGCVVVENLYLHAVIGGVDAHRRADADAVVDPFLHELEFEPQDEIGVLLLGVEVARSAVRGGRRGRS